MTEPGILKSWEKEEEKPSPLLSSGKGTEEMPVEMGAGGEGRIGR